jgi:hypothetical protein
MHLYISFGVDTSPATSATPDRLHQYCLWSSSPTTIYIDNIAASSLPLPLMVIVNANKQLYFFY